MKITLSKFNPFHFRITKKISTIFSTNGLIITLILGIFVNLASNAIQDRIQRQRYLEYLQLEITQHFLTSSSEISNFNEGNDIFSKRFYSDEVFIAGYENGYLLSVDPQILSKIHTYYNVVIEGYNLILEDSWENIEQARAEKLKCLIKLDYQEVDDCDLITDQTDYIVSIFSKNIVNTALDMNIAADEILKEFNPTSERQSSFILRNLMGKESLEILKAVKE